MSNIPENPTNESSKLYAHVVLDRSGSMRSRASDAVDGYNTYVSTLPATARVSLTLFHTESIDLIRDAVWPSEGTLTKGEFVPRGRTPLYDAIGRTVGDAEKRSVGCDRVALVILTDGHENASREFSRSDILKLLKEKQERDSWLVIFLAANQDAWRVGKRFGIDTDNSMSVDMDKFGSALASAGRVTDSYFKSKSAQLGRQTSGFSREDRDLAKKRSD